MYFPPSQRENRLKSEMEIKIEVAAICVSLRIDSAQCINHIKDNYVKFISLKEPVFYLDMRTDEKALPNESSKVGLTVLNNEIIITDEHFSAKIDIISGKGSAVISPDKTRVSIDTLSRNLFTIMLLKIYNGLALHAAVILKDGKAHIFAGSSGSGKTTISQISLSCGFTALSDDLVFIRQLNGSYYVFPTPSWMHLQKGNIENKPYPIGGIYKLIKDDRTYLANISQGIALAEVITIPNISLGSLPLHTLLDRFYEIANRYPVRELHFRKDESFWNYL